MKKYLKYGIMGILAAIVSFLFLKPEKKEVKSTVRSYEEIIQSGVLRAITEYNAFSFHAQEDTVSGFHYELIQAFAKSKNLKVDIIPEMSLEKRIQGVESGEYDILANNVLKTSNRKDSIQYTHPILRAVHKYKDSREQFERRTHKRLIDIVVPGAKTMEALFKIDLPAGVEFDVIQK